MIYREDQADQVLCPERCYGTVITTMCVGRRCSAWRVFDRVTVGDKIVSRTVERGYCGLAGPVKGKFFRWGGER